MPNAKAPAGPGRPQIERRNAADTQEQIDELEGLPDADDLPDGAAPRAGPSGTAARQAERNAPTGVDRDDDRRPRRSGDT